MGLRKHHCKQSIKSKINKDKRSKFHNLTSLKEFGFKIFFWFWYQDSLYCTTALHRPSFQTWNSKDLLWTCVRKNEGIKMCKSLFCVLYKFIQRRNFKLVSFIIILRLEQKLASKGAWDYSSVSSHLILISLFARPTLNSQKHVHMHKHGRASDFLGIYCLKIYPCFFFPPVDENVIFAVHFDWFQQKLRMVRNSKYK